MTYRAPTVEEAVDIVVMSRNRDYTRICMREWREKYGDQFADRVEQKLAVKRAAVKAKR